MFFLGQIGLGWVQRSSKVALKKKGALFGHSSLHRSGYASQRPRGCLFGVCVLGVCVQVCARTFSGLSASEPPVMPPPALWHASSGTLAFSLRLMPPRPVFVHTERTVVSPFRKGLFVLLRNNTQNCFVIAQ